MRIGIRTIVRNKEKAMKNIAGTVQDQISENGMVQLSSPWHYIFVGMARDYSRLETRERKTINKKQKVKG
jgi:hypothetical protein